MTATLLTALTWGLGAFAFCTAAFNLWIFWMRPRDPAHLWLGVMSLGVTWLSSAWAASYQATTVAAASAWVEHALFGAIPFAVGMVRFSQHFAGISHPLLHASIAYLTVGVGVLLAAPELHFTGRAFEVHAIGGLTYLVAEVTPLAMLFLAPFVGAIGYVTWAYRRAAPRLEGGAAISRAISVFGACLANDLCVLFGTHWSPPLSPLGFAVFAGTLGWLLLRRLVRSQRHLEHSAAELNALVAARTEELRRKDLELAHGARLATLGALANGIAVQLDGPLTEVQGHVKVLRDAWQTPESRGAARAPLLKAQAGIERIRFVVAELLQLARREEGVAGRHELAAIVAKVLPIASYELNRRARVRTNLASSPQVHGNSAMLAQVALHLIVGAIQSTPARGNGPTPVVSIETGELGGRAYLAVTDNGAPLPAATGVDLLEAGAHHESDSRSASYAMTRQLVERHGGSFTIESSSAGNRVVVAFAGAPLEGEA
jgi:signal transduction histidine kinase